MVALRVEERELVLLRGSGGSRGGHGRAASKGPPTGPHETHGGNPNHAADGKFTTGSHIKPAHVAEWTKSNAAGVPKIGYHAGSEEHIAGIRARGINVKRNQTGVVQGFHMSSKPNLYGDHYVRVAVRMNNPLRLEAGSAAMTEHLAGLRQRYGKLFTRLGLEHATQQDTQVKRVLRGLIAHDARKQGYDGIIIQHAKMGATQRANIVTSPAKVYGGNHEIIAIKRGTVRVIDEKPKVRGQTAKVAKAETTKSTKATTAKVSSAQSKRFAYAPATGEHRIWPSATHVVVNGEKIPGFIWKTPILGRAIERKLAKNPRDPSEPAQKSQWHVNIADSAHNTRHQAAQALYQQHLAAEAQHTPKAPESKATPKATRQPSTFRSLMQGKVVEATRDGEHYFVEARRIPGEERMHVRAYKSTFLGGSKADFESLRSPRTLIGHGNEARLTPRELAQTSRRFSVIATHESLEAARAHYMKSAEYHQGRVNEYRGDVNRARERLDNHIKRYGDHPNQQSTRRYHEDQLAKAEKRLAGAQKTLARIQKAEKSSLSESAHVITLRSAGGPHGGGARRSGKSAAPEHVNTPHEGQHEGPGRTKASDHDSITGRWTQGLTNPARMAKITRMANRAEAKGQTTRQCMSCGKLLNGPMAGRKMPIPHVTQGKGWNHAQCPTCQKNSVEYYRQRARKGPLTIPTQEYATNPNTPRGQRRVTRAGEPVSQRLQAWHKRAEAIRADYDARRAAYREQQATKNTAQANRDAPRAAKQQAQYQQAIDRHATVRQTREEQRAGVIERAERATRKADLLHQDATARYQQAQTHGTEAQANRAFIRQVVSADRFFRAQSRYQTKSGKAYDREAAARHDEAIHQEIADQKAGRTKRVPRAEHERVVEERDALRAEVERLQKLVGEQGVQAHDEMHGMLAVEAIAMMEKVLLRDYSETVTLRGPSGSRGGHGGRASSIRSARIARARANGQRVPFDEAKHPRHDDGKFEEKAPEVKAKSTRHAGKAAEEGRTTTRARGTKGTTGAQPKATTRQSTKGTTAKSKVAVTPAPHKLTSQQFEEHLVRAYQQRVKASGLVRIATMRGQVMKEAGITRAEWEHHFGTIARRSLALGHGDTIRAHGEKGALHIHMEEDQEGLHRAPGFRFKDQKATYGHTNPRGWDYAALSRLDPAAHLGMTPITGQPKARATKAKAPSAAERVAEMHRQAAERQKAEGLRAEEQPKKHFIPIKTTDESRFNPYRPVDPHALVEFYGHHQVGAMLRNYSSTALRAVAKSYNIPVTGLSANHAHLVTAITHHVTEGRYSANFPAETKAAKTPGTKATARTAKHTAQEQEIARLRKENADLKAAQGKKGAREKKARTEKPQKYQAKPLYRVPNEGLHGLDEVAARFQHRIYGTVQMRHILEVYSHKDLQHEAHQIAKDQGKEIPHNALKTKASTIAHIMNSLEEEQGHIGPRSQAEVDAMKGIFEGGQQHMETWHQPAVTLGEKGEDDFHRTWIMMLPQGKFEHPKHGELDFNRDRLLTFKQHFDSNVRQIDIALDSDHTAEDGDTKAYGWFEAMEFRASDGRTPAGLWGKVKWTPLGVQALKDDIYRYFSVSFGTHEDAATGKRTPDVIIGGALTNRPFLKVMPAVTLAEVSRRPWGAVNKSDLPRSAFLIQGDPEDKSTWKLPVYEGDGAGGRGPLNLNGVRAAYAALHGARSGTPMTVPTTVRARLERWHKRFFEGGSVAASEATRREDGRGVFMKTTQANQEVELDEDETYEDIELDDLDDEDETYQFMGPKPKGKAKKAAPEDEDETDEDEMELDEGDDEMYSEELQAKEPRRAAITLAEYTQLKDEVRQLRAERNVEKQLTAWSGGVRLSEGKGARSVTLTPAFKRAYRAYMLAEGVTLSEKASKGLHELLELAMTSAALPVKLADRGRVYDDGRETKSSKARGMDPITAQSVALSEQAVALAFEAGKTLSELKPEEAQEFYRLAARRMNYGSEQGRI